MDARHSVIGEISFADLCLNRSTREVRCAGRSVVVKHTSCKVLEQLVASAGAVVTRESLLDQPTHITLNQSSAVPYGVSRSQPPAHSTLPSDAPLRGNQRGPT